MPGQRAKRSPTFRAQATLIVLPLLVLVAVGVWSLCQDRLFAEQEARDDARQLAERLLPEMLDAFADPLSVAFASADAEAPAADPTLDAVLFQVSKSGRLLKPAPVADPLPRPLDPAELDPVLAEIWQAARGAEFRDSASDTALTHYRLFLTHAPPDDFAAAARMSVALIEAQQGRQQESIEQLRTVISGSLVTLLESGLPAQAVAALKLVELAVDSAEIGIEWVDLLTPVLSNAVENPSWVTQPLLQAVARLAEDRQLPELGDWLSLWIQHERARRVYDAFGAQLSATALGLSVSADGSTSSPFWFSTVDGAWLAFPGPVTAHRWIVCVPERVVGQLLESVWRDAGNLPAYLGAGVALASRQLRLGNDPLTSHWQPGESSRLATQSITHPVLGLIELDIVLTNPPLLFARQRTRTYWFAALIAVAASAALVGLISAWRAFHRQELLARMQSQFVSSVSHELRAPIASIRLLAEGLELGRVRAADKQAEYFSLMGQECRRLTALIENVLDFSRIEQGRKQFEFEPTDVRALVQQTVRLMEPQATERQVTLTIGFQAEEQGPQTTDHGTTDHETTGSHPQPSLDGRAIQQALVNLIDNAIKHAPPNSSIEVSLAFGPPVQEPANDPSPDQTDHTSPFRIWIRDSGEGIPAAEHEKIFEPFYRRGTELRRETTGIGIGLTIVRHIVAAHGGRVTVESEPGHGSKFILHFP